MEKIPFNGLLRDEMCNQLHCSVPTLRKKVKAGELRMSKIGDQYYYFFAGAPAHPTSNSGAFAPPPVHSGATDLRPATVHDFRSTAPAVAQAAQLSPVQLALAQTVPAQTHELALERIAELVTQQAVLSEKNTDLTEQNAKLQVDVVHLNRQIESLDTSIASLNLQLGAKERTNIWLLSAGLLMLFLVLFLLGKLSIF